MEAASQKHSILVGVFVSILFYILKSNEMRFGVSFLFGYYTLFYVKRFGLFEPSIIRENQVQKKQVWKHYT